MVGPISFVCVLIEHCSKINQLVQAILMSIDCPFTQRDCGCRAFNQIIEDDFAVIVGGLCSTVCFQQGFVPRGNAERPSLQPVVILDNTVQSVKSFFVMLRIPSAGKDFTDNGKHISKDVALFRRQLLFVVLVLSFGFHFVSCHVVAHTHDSFR